MKFCDLSLILWEQVSNVHFVKFKKFSEGDIHFLVMFHCYSGSFISLAIQFDKQHFPLISLMWQNEHFKNICLQQSRWINSIISIIVFGNALHNGYLIVWTLYPVGTDQLLNHSSMLIFGWEMSWKCNNGWPKINSSTSNQQHFNHFSTVGLIFQLQTWLIFWLNCGWKVDFWLIIVTFSTRFSTKYQLRRWLRKVEAQVDLCPLG